MSSNFERKSLDRLKEQSRQQLQTAAEVVPCVTVTEKNWTAMIGHQQSQIQLLVEIQTAAAQLATKEELMEYLDQRVQELEHHSMEMQSVAQNFRQRMEQSADEITNNLSSQAGRISENFSQNLSLEQERMSKYTDRLFCIALIPSAVLVILELISHIFRLM